MFHVVVIFQQWCASHNFYVSRLRARQNVLLPSLGALLIYCHNFSFAFGIALGLSLSVQPFVANSSAFGMSSSVLIKNHLEFHSKNSRSDRAEVKWIEAKEWKKKAKEIKDRGVEKLNRIEWIIFNSGKIKTRNSTRKKCMLNEHLIYWLRWKSEKEKREEEEKAKRIEKRKKKRKYYVAMMMLMARGCKSNKRKAASTKTTTKVPFDFSFNLASRWASYLFFFAFEIALLFPLFFVDFHSRHS